MQGLIDWIGAHGLVLILATVGLLLFYRVARPAIHRLLVAALRGRAAALGDGPAIEAETDKRVATIEDLLAKLLRVAVVGAFILVIFGIFDLWPILAGLGIVAAAITLAGQSIVLDYLMGFLILMEGQYFKGDVILVGGIEGTVEEVGLRRTIIRDTRGTLHSISNGIIRQSSNLTRTYAVAMVFLEGIGEADVERTIEVLDRIGGEFQADPTWTDRLLEAPRYTGTTALRADGATLRLSGRVRPEARVAVETELRRRVALGLAGAGIEPRRSAFAGPAPG